MTIFEAASLTYLKLITLFESVYYFINEKLAPQKPTQIAMICNPAVTIKLLPKSMRQIYAAMVKYEIEQAKPNESDNFYDFELAKHLGHDAERDIDTVQSYKDIVIHD